MKRITAVFLVLVLALSCGISAFAESGASKTAPESVPVIKRYDYDASGSTWGPTLWTVLMNRKAGFDAGETAALGDGKLEDESFRTAFAETLLNDFLAAYEAPFLIDPDSRARPTCVGRYGYWHIVLYSSGEKAMILLYHSRRKEAGCAVLDAVKPEKAAELVRAASRTEFYLDDGSERAWEAEKKEEELRRSFNTKTSFPVNKDQLRNWDRAAMKETYGVSGVEKFTPSDPQPMTYIISAKEVIDPVTNRVSEGGYNHETARHLPIDTQDLMWVSGEIMDSGLTFTDDPNKASYALILDFDYKYKKGSFQFSDAPAVTQYHSATSAKLLDLVTGEWISTGKVASYATEAGESVRTKMLDAAKGKQLYSRSAVIRANDFSCYWEFVAGGQRRKDALAASKKGHLVITLLPRQFNKITRQALKDYLNEQGIQKVTLQDDGCVTLILSKKEKQKLDKRLKEDMKTVISEMEHLFGVKRKEQEANEMTEFRFTAESDSLPAVFDDYASRLMFLGRIYTATENQWGKTNVRVEVENAKTRKSLYNESQ